MIESKSSYYLLDWFSCLLLLRLLFNQTPQTPPLMTSSFIATIADEFLTIPSLLPLVILDPLPPNCLRNM